MVSAVKHEITAALASSEPCEDDMLRRDVLKTAMTIAVLAPAVPVQAKKALAMSNGHVAIANGQHLFYSVHGGGKPLILLHGGIG